TIVFLMFVVPPLLKMPPPAPAVLALTVLFVNVSVLLFKMPPPVVALELPLTGLLVSVRVPPLKMPLPLPAVLPLTVLFVTVAPVLLKMPPPTALAVLPLSVLFVTVSVPWLRMPPPLPAVLPLTVLFVRLTVAVLLLRIPPPAEPPGAFPFDIVKSENVTTPGLAIVTLKTRELLLPEIVNRFARSEERREGKREDRGA